MNTDRKDIAEPSVGDFTLLQITDVCRLGFPCRRASQPS
jgi:hypothetical protein